LRLVKVYNKCVQVGMGYVFVKVSATRGRLGAAWHGMCFAQKAAEWTLESTAK